MTSKYFISAWWLVTDLISIFNADSRKSVSKFSGLRWFLVVEDLQNEQKTSEMQLKTVSNFKATANFFNFLTLKKEKKSCNKSVNFILISLFDDLITTYFPFLRDISPKNRMLCLRNACETFKTFSRFYSLYLQTYN